MAFAPRSRRGPSPSCGVPWDQIVLVSEEEIVAAMRLLWERLKMVVEPSGAVSAVLALFGQIGASGKKVGIILSGGNLDLDSLPFGGASSP